MKKTIFNVILFAAGAAVGSLVTWKVVKTKYEREMQAEIDAFKKDFMQCMMNDPSIEIHDTDEWDDESIEEDPDLTTYRDLAYMYNRSGDEAENGGEGAGDKEVPYINGPYVITPEDFADGNYDHELHSLTYYSDGVLADDWLVPQDIEETIGEDSLEHIGDYAEDIVHVRNERMNADYEVVRDPRKYADVAGNIPPTQTHAD